jgi:hypothetical protein
MTFREVEGSLLEFRLMASDHLRSRLNDLKLPSAPQCLITLNPVELRASIIGPEIIIAIVIIFRQFDLCSVCVSRGTGSLAVDEALVGLPRGQRDLAEPWQATGGPEGGDAVHHRGGQSASTRAGIEQMNRGTIQTRFMKPSRQKSCDGRRGEELALLASLRPLLAHASLPADGIGQGENLGCGRWSHGFI